MKNRRSTAGLLLAAAAALLAAACSDSEYVINSNPPDWDFINGNGSPVEETRAIGGFNRVTLQGVGNLYIRQGSREELRVRAEENLLEYLKTDVQGGELLIWKTAVSIQNTYPIEYHLTVVDLDRIALTGAGRIEGNGLSTGPLVLRKTGLGNLELSNLTAASLNVDTSGIGDLVLSGSTQDQTVRLSGMGNYDGGAMHSSEATVLVTESGSATVRVRDRLNATVRGSGSVYYIGNPVVSSDVTGSGNVVKVGG